MKERSQLLAVAMAVLEKEQKHTIHKQKPRTHTCVHSYTYTHKLAHTRIY